MGAETRSEERGYSPIWASGAVTGGLVAAFIGFGVSLDLDDSMVDFVITFQTLIAGAFATVAGFGTIILLYRQTRIAQRQAIIAQQQLDDNRQAMMLSGKLPLADHLSSVVSYAECCMALALMLRNEIVRRYRSSEDAYDRNVQVPELTLVTKDGLSRAAGVLPKVEATRIADLLSYYQIQQARLTSLKRDVDDPHRGGVLRITVRENGQQAIVDAARILKKAEEIFPYAREGSTMLGPMEDEERAAVDQIIRRVLHIDDLEAEQ
jgi:hypothetical protein